MSNKKMAAERFDIRLLIKHPSIDPSKITEAIGISPVYQKRFGAQRASVNGTLLPGINTESGWGSSLRVLDKRHFFDHVKALVEELQIHSKFLDDLIDGGGSVSIILHLPGDVNIGDHLDIETMRLMSSMRIDLGIEIFPHFN
jgi:hypothetical protein